MKKVRIFIKWLKKVGIAFLKPDNIVNGIGWILIISFLLTIVKPVFLDKVELNVYSNAYQEKETDEINQTTLYFTLFNKGTIPLKIIDIHFSWQDYERMGDTKQEKWNEEEILFLDENEQEITIMPILPNEKIKVHGRINKPDSLKSNIQLTYLCLEYSRLKNSFFANVFKKDGSLECEPSLFHDIIWE